MMRPEDATGYLPDLFERAQRALTERLQPALDEALAAPLRQHGAESSADASGQQMGSIAAQFRVDEQTKQVLLRIYDVRTGTTIREVTASQVAAAARLRRFNT